MYAFLSDEWISAARQIRARYADQIPGVAVSVRINQVISQVPFGDGVVHAHIDTSNGATVFDLGHLDEPDAVVMTDYATAKALIVERDPAVVMQAFLAGKITVQGDMMKLIAMQSAVQHDEVGEQVAAEILAITASD